MWVPLNPLIPMDRTRPRRLKFSIFFHASTLLYGWGCALSVGVLAPVQGERTYVHAMDQVCQISLKDKLNVKRIM